MSVSSIGFGRAVSSSQRSPVEPEPGPASLRTVSIRSELDLDRSAQRVVDRIVDRATGEVVRQYPAEETLRLLAKSRAQFRPLLKFDV